MSSNINEVIRSVLNFLFFFTIRFYTHKKRKKNARHQTSLLSLLSFSTVSTGYGRYSLTISSTENGRDSLVATSLSKHKSPFASRFSGAMFGLATRS